MGRYDKYDPVSGGFRAPLGADYAGSETPVGVGLNANGRVVVGGGQTGVVGLLVKVRDANAGDIVDVMTDGEIVEFGGVAGTVYYVDATNGALSTSADAGGAAGSGAGHRIGHTVEADRLVVRVAQAA